jgi:hypothetical protein
MPFIEGETLRTRLERESRLPAGAVIGILADLVDALAHAHDRGLVHRDIKPENILLQGNHALLTDFGVAKAITAALPGSLGGTAVGMTVGTPAYMAPEQLAADPAADHRMDIYAVGLVAYELLSGSSPFSGRSPQATLASQLTQRPTPPHISRPDVSPALSDIVMRCLEKEPAQRYASARDLIAELQAVPVTPGGALPSLDALEIYTRGVMAGRRDRLLNRWVRAVPRRAWPWLAAAALLVAGGVTGALLVRRGGAPAGSAPPTAASDAPLTITLADSADPALRAGAVTVPVLTRADSEAIAAAVGRRLERTPPATPALSQRSFDSLVAALERLVLDSVLRALAEGRAGPRPPPPPPGAGHPAAEPGPGSGGRVASRSDVRTEGRPTVFDFSRPRAGPRRVVVAPVADASRGGLTRLAGRLTDSLAARFAADRRFALVPMEETREALRRSRNAFFLAGALEADLIVSAAVDRGDRERPEAGPPGGGPADSVRFLAVVTDPRDPFGTRSVRHEVAALDAAAKLPGFVRQVHALAVQGTVRVEAPGGALHSSPRFVRLDSVARDSLRRVRDSIQRAVRRDTS